MATQALVSPDNGVMLENVLIGGDLSVLSAGDRLVYYRSVCESLKLNPLTKPFEYIVLNEKLTLYARKDATDQLRAIHKVNVSIVARESVEGIYVVTAKATMPDGRTDESIGAVPLIKDDGAWETAQNGKRFFKKNGKTIPLGADERANAIMKAETKAKRRVTLSIVGLGMLDETELETIPSAKVVSVDTATGEITGNEPHAKRPTVVDFEDLESASGSQEAAGAPERAASTPQAPEAGNALNAILNLAKKKGIVLTTKLREWHQAGTYSAPSLPALQPAEIEALKKWLNEQPDRAEH